MQDLNQHMVVFFWAVAVAFSWTPAGSVNAQSCPALAGTESFGILNQTAFDVFIDGNYAYTADLYGLTVYDIESPANPVFYGELLLPDAGSAVVVSDDVAYVADMKQGLQIVDVGRPDSPEVIGQLALDGYATGIAVSGTLVLVTVNSGGVALVDVTDLANPSLEGVYDTPGYAVDVVIDRDRAYVGDSYSGIEILDISVPSSPSLLGRYDLDGFSFHLEISGDKLFASTNNGLHILDVSDPAHSSLVGSFPKDNTDSFALVGHTVFLMADPGLITLDVSTMSAPTEVGQYQAATNLGLSRMAVHGETAILTSTRGGFETVDISNPTNVSRLGFLDTGGSVKEIAIAGGHALVADYSGGLQIVDVSNPDAPFRTSEIMESGLGALSVVSKGSRAYVAFDAVGLGIVDISDPAHPTMLGSASTSGTAMEIAVSGDTVYLGDASGISVIDVGDEAHPSLLGHCSLPQSPTGMARDGSTLFVSDYTAGVQIVDVSSPASPHVIATLETPYRARDVAVEEHIAFIGDDNGLIAADVANPAHPITLSTLPLNSQGVAVFDNLLFVAVEFDGLKIFNVTDPTNMELIASMPMPQRALNVAFDPLRATLWVGMPSLIQAVDFSCPVCEDLRLSAEPQMIEAGGHEAVITARVSNFLGNAAPGASVVGSTTRGSLSAFTDQGDGSYTATLTSDQAGGSAVITVSVDGTPCSVETVVDIVGGLPLETSTWIPVAVHAEGANDSSWRTALGILGVGNDETDITIWFLSEADPVVKAMTLSPDRQLILSDVVGWLGVDGSGSMAVESEEPIIVTSRTYTAFESGNTCFGGGTLGQFLAASDRSAVLGEGEGGWLPQLTETRHFRTNIALTNTGTSPAEARVTLFGPENIEIGSFPVSLGPGQWVQENRVFARRFGITDLSTGYARVDLDSGSGVIGYASVVDNMTNDPTTIPLVSAGQGETIDTWIAVASHAEGVNNSLWRTNLGLLNTGTSTAEATVSAAGSSMTVSVCPGCQSIIDDVLGRIGLSGSAPVRITASTPLIVTSRTFTELPANDPCWPGGTLGQYLPGSALDVVLNRGDTAWLPQLVENTAFRTNIAFTNTGGNPAVVEIGLFDGDATFVGSYQVALDPGRWVQDNRPFANRFGRDAVDAGYARIEILSGSGILGYASVIDEVTNDPTTIPLALLR